MTNPRKNSSVLVLSMAAAGYHWWFADALLSQRQYAQRNGYDYLCAEGPLIHRFGSDIVWFKLHLLHSALLLGYQWVIFVDADAAITERCPALESLEQEGKSIYMAHGYSGRFNSGVIILKHSNASIGFIKRVLESRGCALEPEDDVGWGENGHVIARAKCEPAVEQLSGKWNNNFDPTLPDYIRHYSAGPLREMHKVGVDILVVMFALSLLNKVIKRMLPKLQLVHQASIFKRWSNNTFRAATSNGCAKTF